MGDQSSRKQNNFNFIILSLLFVILFLNRNLGILPLLALASISLLLAISQFVFGYFNKIRDLVAIASSVSLFITSSLFWFNGIYFVATGQYLGFFIVDWIITLNILLLSIIWVSSVGFKQVLTLITEATKPKGNNTQQEKLTQETAIAEVT
jgi:hypothetical protein